MENLVHQVKTEVPTILSSSQARTLISASKVHIRPQVEEHKDPWMLPSKVSIQQEGPLGNTMSLDLDEPSWKRCKKVQITWQSPAGTFACSAPLLTLLTVCQIILVSCALQVKIKAILGCVQKLRGDI